MIGQVVRETEGAGQIAACFAEHGGDCAIAPQCRLRDVLEEGVAAFYHVLDGYTLAQLVVNQQELATVLFPALHAPRAAARAGSAP